MSKIKVIIIDDEEKARELLIKMLAEYCKDTEVVASCNDIPNAVKSIKKFNPDLVFTDIEMPGHSGLELIDFFNEEEINFSIIFTTAYNQYAIQAMKISALDYILKPIEPEELEHAVAKHVKKSQKEFINYKSAVENIKVNINQKIAIPTRNGYKMVDPDEIILIKADSSYTEVILSNSQKIIASRILRNFEDALSHLNQFFRAHKSFIINIKYASEYVKSDGGYIILDNQYQASISPEKVDEFMQKMITVNR